MTVAELVAFVPFVLQAVFLVGGVVLLVWLASVRRGLSALESATLDQAEEAERSRDANLAAQATQVALASRLEAIEKAHVDAEKRLREEIGQNRREAADNARIGREELGATLGRVADSMQERLGEMATAQAARLDAFSTRLEGQAAANEKKLTSLTRSNEEKLEQLRQAVDDRLGQMRRDNGEQLERMRATVDEKLQGTLEKRLGESFKQVSERLEQVHQGLGEMQTLAGGVGDLKRVLSNVKLRGGWGEVQLGALLEDMLTPDQYVRNVRPREESAEVVEFAIRLPGKEGDPDDAVWLPIDAKFPLEDYQRLVDASEAGDRVALEAAAKDLERQILSCAKDISTKYIHPPLTTDFAVMFLPTEGLYAEIVRRPGLVDRLQRERRVVVAGPSTFAGLLNSLQMGFRTLAIQERSSEVWQLLGAVKTEFGKFGDTLDGVNRKLAQASKTMDDAARRSRAIERKLRDVEEIPVGGGTLGVLEEGLDADASSEGESSEEAARHARVAVA
ncbi:MAG: DNA recombination protein RmuC [Candidatus Binatia bacterium]|nr:DNA recombination protein RmuC [Candidatus Binatia bacterium]